MTTKICDSIRNTLNRLKTVGTAVVCLLCSGCPVAISLVVAFVVIDPIQAHPFRLYPHVGQEVFKRIHPTLADGYTSPTVILVAGTLWIVTPDLHVRPYLIGFTLGHSMREVFT